LKFTPSLGRPLRLSAEHPHQFGTVGWGEGMDLSSQSREGCAVRELEFTL
jgi:hypothetical protein